MILSPNSSNAPSSAAASAPSFGADTASGDQGFFGLLTQAGAEMGKDGALTPALPTGEAGGKGTVEGSETFLRFTLSEPAAPIATALLVGEAWAASSDLPSDRAPQTAIPVLAMPVLAIPAPAIAVSVPQPVITDAVVEITGLAPEMTAGEAGDDAETEEEDFSMATELAMVGALLIPTARQQPVAILSAGTSAAPVSAVDGTRPVGSAAGQIAAPELVDADDLLDADGVAVAGSAGKDGTAPASKTKAPDAAGKIETGLSQTELAMVELPAETVAASANGKPSQRDPARRESSTRGSASAAVEQPALAAAAVVRPAVTPSPSIHRAPTETISVPEAVTGVSDTAQDSGAGSLDQFSAGGSSDGVAGRPHASGQSQTTQTDFKSLLAATDGATEPHRAVQIATVHLEKAAASRNTDALTIQLEPLDLGKIEVRLDFGNDGRVQASILADKVDTLDLLQRDSRSLERALQSAGLQTDAGSLNFNLRGDSRSGREFGQQRGGRGNQFGAGAPEITEIQIVAARPSLGAAGRVDIRI